MLEGQVKEAKQMVEESDIKYDEVEFWHCTFFVYTNLNFPHFWRATLSEEKAREIQNSVNQKWTISDF